MANLPSQVASLAAYTSVTAAMAPRKLGPQLYRPGVNITPTGIRVYAPWLCITTTIRIFTFLNFGDKAWYDATMVTLLAALGHWISEYMIHGTVHRQQFIAAASFDLVGFGWMWLARDAVTGGSSFRIQ